MYTVGRLKQDLERFNDDTPILVAHQPNYPLQERLQYVTAYSDVSDYEDLDDVMEVTPDEEFNSGVKRILGKAADDICYLVAHGHPHDGSPYAPRAVFEG